MAEDAACCPPDSLPALAESTTGKGNIVKIDGVENAGALEIYIAGSLEKSDNAVILYSDVFGWESGHHKRFCDELQAKLGENYAVVMPDFFRKNPAMQPFTFLPEKMALVLGAPGMIYRIRTSYTKENVVERDCERTVVPWLRTQGINTFSCVGFCYGGWCIAQSLSLESKIFSCGVGMHPSFNVEQIWGRKEDDLATRVGASPILLMPAGNDSKKMKPGGSCVKIMTDARCCSESESSQPFENMVHGWVTRGDTKIPAVAEAQTKALNLCSDFILKHTEN